MRAGAGTTMTSATFEAWLAAADDPALAEPPPPLSPWPVPGGAKALTLANRHLQ